jgi:hypothetical protein
MLATMGSYLWGHVWTMAFAEAVMALITGQTVS